MRRPRRLTVVLVGIVLVVVAAFGWLGLRFHEGRRDALDEALADLRARGEPVELADLVPPAIDPQDDGGPLLREAWEWLEDSGRTHPPEVLSQEDFDALPEERRRELLDAFRAVGPYVRLLREGSERRAWRDLPSPDEVHPMAREMPEVDGLQYAGRWLALGLRTVPPDDPATASEARLGLIRTQGLLGARWDAPRGLIEALVALTVQRHALWRLREQLRLGRIEPRRAVDVLAPLLDARPDVFVARGLRCERVAAVSLLRTLIGDCDDPLPAELASVRGRLPGYQSRFARRELVRHVGDVQGVIDAAGHPWTKPARRAVPLGRHVSVVRLVVGVGPSFVAASEILMPRIVRQGAALATDQRLARCALAAAIQRTETGSWPATLDDVDVPAEARIDPFTDRPLLYEIRADGSLRIASAGPLDAAIWGETAVGDNDPDEDGLVWTIAPR